MKIKVKIGKTREQKHCIRHISLAIPNSLIKTRLAAKIIRSGIERKSDETKTPLISPDYITRERLKKFYACLKEVIKKRGHFNLVEVDASDGTKVIVRV